ncbi:hypothetical protein [Amycolatopsis ultiminotia]|uniref:hypothetical protein n=1 Tax=Amycolatopsis ultiminotia TaxID=543629 RepID=UPI0031E64EA7
MVREADFEAEASGEEPGLAEAIREICQCGNEFAGRTLRLSRSQPDDQDLRTVIASSVRLRRPYGFLHGRGLRP